MNECFAGKSVLVTGHTGFKGSWLVAWLKKLGAEVTGLALDPPTDPSHFEAAGIGRGVRDVRCDIRDGAAVAQVLRDTQPDFVFHLAAQALVRKSYADPLETWQTNVMGTLHVLDGLRFLDKACAAVIITSDKCYDNVEWVWGYRETDAVGGIDPYSASKGAADLAIRSHVRSYFPAGKSKVRIASARAGNVIGGGDWATDRIIPDCVLAWSRKDSVELRNPRATRPWQHVLEPLSGYLTLAEELAGNAALHGEAFNFGPSPEADHTVEDLVERMSLHWEDVRWHTAGAPTGPHESSLLKLNCDKALNRLAWTPTLNFDETVRITAEWYRGYYARAQAVAKLTDSQISDYEALMSVRRRARPIRP